MSILPFLDIGMEIIDKLIPDPKQKAKYQLDLIKLQQDGQFKELETSTQISMGQIEVNKIEAANGSLFVSGWRPAIGWMCAGGLAYQFLGRPIMGWVIGNAMHWPMPPSLEIETLMTLIFGMLGLGAMRTAEKINGVSRP